MNGVFFVGSDLTTNSSYLRNIELFELCKYFLSDIGSLGLENNSFIYYELIKRKKIIRISYSLFLKANFMSDMLCLNHE